MNMARWLRYADFRERSNHITLAICIVIENI